MESNTSYQQTLSTSIKSTHYFMLLAIFSAFLYGSRTSVWVEYGKTFTDSSIHLISWVLYIDSLLIGIAGLVFASLGDYIGFDKALSFKLLIMTIGCFIEAFTNNFYIYCVGFLVSQTATIYISTAYMSYILPTTFAKKQISKLFAIAYTAYLFGPVFSGTIYKISDSYRMIFILNSIFVGIGTIISFINYGKQSKIEKAQIDVELNRQSNDINEIFPAYIQYQKNIHVTWRQSLFLFFKEISIFRWFIIVEIIIENSLFVSFEAIILTFYVPYILGKYNVYQNGQNEEYQQNIVLQSTFQMMTMSISNVVTFAMMSTYNEAITKLNRYIHPNLVIINFYLLLIGLHCLYLLDVSVSIYYYWIYPVFCGSFIAFPMIILEYMLLELYPRQHAGKINGIKSVIQNTVRGILLLGVGLLWKTSFQYDSLLYIIIMTCTVGLIMRCICWMLTEIFTQNTYDIIPMTDVSDTEYIDADQSSTSE